MNFTFNHNNLNVLDLEKSLDFYKKALGLEVVRKKEASDGSFILAFLSDKTSTQKLELTWLRDWDRPYNLGDNEFHLALEVEEFDEAKKLHKDLDCICFENESMGIYFIADPDNYWIEILPKNH